MKIRYFSATDVGRERGKNEDNHRIRRFDDEHHLFIVADGMGGHERGDQASFIACTQVEGIYRLGYNLLVAVQDANKAVWRAGNASRGRKPMGTTCTAAVIRRGVLSCVHVGDSRMYRLRGGALEQLTTDHTLAERMIRLKQEPDLTEEEIKTAWGHILTSHLGQDIGLQQVDIFTQDVLPGDRYLLCSDGLTGELNDAQIRYWLSQGADPETLVRRFITEANAAGGNDNITAIVIFIES